MKTSSIIATLAILLGVAALLLLARLDKLESRLQTAETALSTLEPLRHLLSQARPAENPCQPIQATGAPNVPQDAGDHVNAWCPESEDAGPEWLLLTFENAITTSTIEVHATFNPGAIIKAESVSDDGLATTLWTTTASGKDASRLTLIKLPSPVAVKRLRLTLDTTAVPGWNQIDAAALHDKEGKPHWAAQAEASSSWKAPQHR